MKRYADKELTPIEYGLSPVKIIDFHVPPETTCFPFHWHERMEMLYIDSGDLFISCGGQDFAAHAGDLIVVNCGQMHTAYSGKDPVYYRVFMFELSGLSGVKTEIYNYLEPMINGRILFEPLIRDEALKPLFNTMCKEKESADFAYPLYLKSYIYLLLGHLCRDHVKSRLYASPDDKKIYEILEYIDNHFTQNISAGVLSKKFGYDEAYFCRKFKRATGMPPSKYINAMRLENAEKLLLTTELTCEQIAFNCGFCDPNYFSRCFSKAFGMTPTARRNMDNNHRM